MIAKAPIGLFDSGLGGLTVLKELRELLPGENFIYLGDTARAPYGSKGASTIRRYSLECGKYLQGHGIKLLVVACNTASSFALHDLEGLLPFPVIGTIAPAVQAALAVPNIRRVAILGTRATIASRAYQEMLLSQAPKCEILERACPFFVPLVEEGQTKGALVNEALDLYLKDIRAAEVDAVILGCTHYPLLVEALSEYFGPRVRLIECSKVIANQVKSLLERDDLLAGKDGLVAGQGSERYFVTDEVGKFNSLATLFLEKGSIEAVKVDDL